METLRPGSIAVVHLVRAANGVEPFERFLASYRRWSAGAEHELVILFKGFSGDGECKEYVSRLGEMAHRVVAVDDLGYDLHAYGLASRQVEADYFCFLNSFSEVLADGWLAKMRDAFGDGVGLVGATGSYESRYSNLWRKEYKWRARGWRRWMQRLSNARKMRRLRLYYGAFPNPHIRTNAFMLRGEVMRQIWPARIESKDEALLFESGKSGLTRQVEGLGLKALVVGRNGMAYESADWAGSGTFRSGEQKNLLVADNQTREFAGMDAKGREKASRLAWEDPNSFEMICYSSESTAACKNRVLPPKPPVST